MDVVVNRKNIRSNIDKKKKTINSLGSGINDFSVRRKPSRQKKQVASKPSHNNNDFDDGDDDDFMFGDLQNKSKTLPDDEFMLGDDEEFVFDGNDDDDKDDFSDDDGDFGDDDDDRDDFDMDSDDEEGSDDDQPRAPREERRSYEDIQMEKQHYLMKIERLKKQGFFPRRELSLRSKLEDIKFEYECLFKERGMEKAIKEWREDVVLYAAGGERVNKWAKKPMHLTNWSKQVHNDAQDGDFDPIFEQLHDKYGGSSMLPPEIQLVTAMGMSAVRFHFSHQVAKDAPDIHSALENNPALRDQVYAELQRQAVNNWSGSGGDNRQPPPTSGPGPMSMGPSGGPQVPGNANNPLANGPPMPTQSRGQKMQGPSQETEDLLKKDLEHINDGVDFDATILSDSDNNEEMSISIDNSKKKKRNKKSFNVSTIDL